ncbi:MULTISPECIES: DEAD/DEAH box helicase [unclassified Oleiphilus]|jgi:superfamily II DNA/RNA helicase|nr:MULTISPECIES: DEAD/DEAH box helicase [unclassified Oleiphilus]KZY43434.1 DEAD/DEAH box helicase [Oleiphilus sp. HI0050]KZY77176.1 DEAD/DEAH box helicase [Oleiphilus sp. HI0068]KZY79305.1 DEAD/DEAH box helicase [Oleiphilus sp. HI0069]KZZ30136.1 DEAD/DEAH box helicase [Oleiphilus sp. HI0081]KZY30611.1 DEAD/DEAH box helicase [Oleiphilus sp. HI0043]
MPFSKLGLSDPILKAITDKGYTEPSPIQCKAIPAIIAGRDVVAASQTGTGKTASFVLPLLEKLNVPYNYRGKRIRALIITPTRELTEQIEANITQYGKYLNLKSMAMYGGIAAEPQKKRLIEGVDILVATPGRLLEMVYDRAVHFDELEVLILDEADRMLNMGFIDEINKIIDRLPSERQSLLFSATLTDDVRFLAKTVKDEALEIAISPEATAATTIDQWLITVDKDKKSALLSHLIIENQWDQALIFIEKKHGAAKLAAQLGKRGIHAEAIHGDRSQAMRAKILNDFKSGEIKFLVATGVAARGIDIGKLSRVVNYDLPFKPEEYIHRIGRTGRAGAIGEAISFVSMGDFKNLCAIESRLGHIIERKEIEGFPVRKVVPVSILNYVPKNKRPANKKTEQKKQDSPKKKINRNKPNTTSTSAKRPAKTTNKTIWGDR